MVVGNIQQLSINPNFFIEKKESKQMTTSRERFLSKAPRSTLKVSVEGFDEDVFISAITATEKEQWEDFVSEAVQNKTFNIRAKLISLSLVDADSQRIFSDGDVEAIGEKPNRVTEPLYEAMMDFNGFSKKAKEALEKNSEPTPAVDSTST